MRVKHFLLLITLMLTMVGNEAHAQFDTGTLIGTVRDNTGAVIPEATITITNSQTGLIMTKVSGNSGDWEAQGLRAGTYDVQVTKSGFAPTSASDFTLSVGSRQRVDLTLSVGVAQQSIEVSGVALALETDSSQRGQ